MIKSTASIMSEHKCDEEISVSTDVNKSSVSKPLNLSQMAKEEPYSLFTPRPARYTITLLLGLSVLSSPLAATIYLPLLPLLSDHFDVSAQAVNLTLTVYIIFQALSPLLLSTYSDTLGRRPLYLITFAIFSLASLGLALNRSSYAGLLVLRALQSLGASSVLSIVYGTVADISTSSQRGKLLGPIMAAGNLGTAIGPIIGGAIAYTSRSVWWAFWALTIYSSLMFLAFLILVPETARKLVGNGSTALKVSRWQFWDRSLIALPRAQSQTPSQNPARRNFAIKSPLKSLTLMRHPDTLLTLYIVGSYYALWYTVQASIPSTFSAPPYNFNPLQLGLAYLTGATGVIVCMFATGKAMDHNYRVIAQRHNFLPDPSPDSTPTKAHSITSFPIEYARSRFCIPLFLLSIICTIGYGWSIHAKAYVSVPLILQFFIGFLGTWILNVFNALLVDIYPETPSAAATAGNLWRCGVSAGAVAAMEPLFKVIGRGWFFTAAGVLSGVLGMGAVWILRKKGMKWRGQRDGTGSLETCDIQQKIVIDIEGQHQKHAAEEMTSRLPNPQTHVRTP